MPNTIVDDTEKVIDDSGADKVVDDADKVADNADKVVDKVADKAQAGIDTILEKHNFTSIDDLEAALGKGQTLAELIGDRDAVKLVRDAEKLNKYEEAWKKEDQLKLQDEETPEETISRLTKEVTEKESQLKSRDMAAEDQKKIEKQIKNFEKTVTNEVSKEEFPEEMEKFLGIFTGLKHPALSVKLDDLAGAKSMAKNQVKLFRELEQVVIRRYIDGKAKIIDVKPVDTSDAPVDKGAKVGNLKDARKILRERVATLLKGK